MIAATLLAAIRFSMRAGWEILLSIPELIAMRRRRPGKGKPVVLLFSEFGDEVNGIANSTRELVHVLHELKKDVLYLTPAHSTRNRLEWETPAVGILPLAVSLDTPGYPGVEMAFPRLRPLLEIIRERGVTHVDILTPSLGCMALAPVFRWIGLSISSQYRTDIFAFGRYLGVPEIMLQGCHISLGRFLHSTRSIGLPSAAYRDILARRYPRLRAKMVVLARGLPMRFDAWGKNVAGRRAAHVEAPPGSARRFFHLGRISKEKNLAFLAAIWKSDKAFRGIPLTFFGDGPFKDELAKDFADYPLVTFPGVVAMEDLPTRLCELDFLAFPSGTDTLGQAVLEALCMGIPVLVSDRGGPAELVQGKENGFVLPLDDLRAWSTCVLRCAAMGRDEYAELSSRARRYAESREPIAAAERHWKHWVEAGAAGT
jgi:glycosyltransferase involved in cell wall biosynthesis